MKKEQAGGILIAFSDAYKTQDWKNAVKESTNYVESDEAYDTYKPRIYSLTDEVYSKAKSKLPKIEDDFQIVTNDDEMDKTMFGMTMIKRADEMFAAPQVEEQIEEKVEPIDTVSDNSFIISKDELPTLNPEVRPEDSFTAAITPIEEDETDEYEGEVVSFETEKTKSKVKTLGKKAAYVDTVILCLIAQLSIFGLLIIVLLIIK